MSIEKYLMVNYGSENECDIQKVKMKLRYVMIR